MSKPPRLSREELDAALVAIHTWLDEPGNYDGFTPAEILPYTHAAAKLRSMRLKRKR